MIVFETRSSERPPQLLVTTVCRLASCHDPKWTSDKLATCLKKGLAQVLAVHGGEIEHGPMVIAAQEGGGGKSMPMGVFARWRAPELSAHVAPPPS